MAMFTSRRRPLVVAVGSVLAFVLAACGGGDNGGDNGGGGGSSEPIKIGTSLPLTGEFSQPGSAAKQGYQVWQEMVNANGGLLGRKVEITYKDDGSNQNTVVSDYNALISQDKVDLLLGTFSSLLNLPASAVAEKNQMLYVEPAGGSPEMFTRGFKYLFFAQQSSSDKQGKVFAEWVAGLPESERPKTAAYPALDDPFAGPNVGVCKEQDQYCTGIRSILEDAGIKTVYKEIYAIDTKNFDTIVNAMKAKKPDLVVNGAQFEDGIGMTRAMLKASFTPSMFYQTNAPSFGDQYSQGIGAENTEGVLYAVSHSPDANTPGNAEFVKKYDEMFGEGGAVPEDAADAYAAGQVLQAAVEAAGDIEDQQGMADWLHQNQVDTILGPLSWDETGNPQGEFLIGQWQNGKPEIVLPEDAATADIEIGWKPGGAG